MTRPPEPDAPQGPLPRPIAEIALGLGLREDEIAFHGRYQAKVSPDVLARFPSEPAGKYIVVTSLTRPSEPEGDPHTTCIGLAMAMNRLGYRTVASLREPVSSVARRASPTSAAHLWPQKDMNWSGDAFAVGQAHNLLAAAVDEALYRGYPALDPFSITWPRVMTVEDRALRQVTIGLGGKENGIPRQTEFSPVSASEIMALLALVNGRNLAKAQRDLHDRLARVVVGTDRESRPITALDLDCVDEMSAQLEASLWPNLVQTAENTPVFLHTHAVGTLFQGGASILADRLACTLSDYAVAEAEPEFGLERFINVKARVSGLFPQVAVIVATLQGLAQRGGARPEDGYKQTLAALEKGCATLAQQIENARRLGLGVVVALQCEVEDADRELGIVERAARESGAEGAFVSDVHVRGGAGGITLAEAVARAAQRPPRAHLLYTDALPLRAKVERVLGETFGGGPIEWSARAEEKIARYTALGYDRMPICIYKAPLASGEVFEHPSRTTRGRVPVLDLQVAAGAGLITARCGLSGPVREVGA